MSEYESYGLVILLLSVIIGLFIGISRPVTKLNATIKEILTKIERIEKKVKILTYKNRNSHKRLHERINIIEDDINDLRLHVHLTDKNRSIFTKGTLSYIIDGEKKGEDLMNINWSVRFKNKTFWLTLIPACLLLAQVVLVPFGIDFKSDVLNGQLLAIINALFVVLTIIGVISDPTVKGLSDSDRALVYTTPAPNSKD